MTTDAYRQAFVVRWGDLDANGHMKNTAFLDVCVDTRFGYFASRGLKPAEFAKLRIGPVVRRDEVDYYRELRFLDPFTVDIELAGLSEDASRFAIQNRIFRDDGSLAAKVVSSGGWLDLDGRRLVAPPRLILDALSELPRTDGFEQLKSSVR
ncbi:MAG: thioesterase [Betaproteobacteria bacterium]|nr:thioesterase [Betaproteobacteria bacterium]